MKKSFLYIFLFVVILNGSLYKNHPYAIFSENMKFVAELMPSKWRGRYDGSGVVYAMNGKNVVRSFGPLIGMLLLILLH